MTRLRRPEEIYCDLSKSRASDLVKIIGAISKSLEEDFAGGSVEAWVYVSPSKAKAIWRAVEEKLSESGWQGKIAEEMDCQRGGTGAKVLVGPLSTKENDR